MPILRRLLWPWLLLPVGSVAAIVAFALHRGGFRPIHVWVSLLAVGFFCGLYAALVGVYRQWSQPGPPLEGALVPPEPAVLVSKGGFLTPGSGAFTREKLVLFSAGRAMVTVPFERVSQARFVRGRFLRTPYLELFALDGRSLGKLAVESAEAWCRALEGLVGPRQG